MPSGKGATTCIVVGLMAAAAAQAASRVQSTCLTREAAASAGLAARTVNQSAHPIDGSRQTNPAAPGGPLASPRGGDTIYIVEQSGFFSFPNVTQSKIARFPSVSPNSPQLLGQSSPAVRFVGMDFHPTSHVLYGIESTTNSLRIIDRDNGTSVRVGMTAGQIPLQPTSPGGLTFSLDGSQLFGTDSRTIMRINSTMGSRTSGQTLRINGGSLPSGYGVAGLATAPEGIADLPAGTILGIAIQPGTLPRGRLITINPDNGAIVTFIDITITDPPNYDVRFDQGLDFAPSGVLYGCLQGNTSSGSLFVISLAADATRGRATAFPNTANFHVSNSTAAWDVGSIAVDQGPPIVSACCLANGQCQELVASICLNGGGTPQDAGSNCGTVTCPTPQACCLTGLTCTDVPTATCESQGGTPQGAGTMCAGLTCPTPRACCLPGGSCDDLLPSQCVEEGGSPQGPNSTCQMTVCSNPCACPGDVNGDAMRDGDDILAFVTCVTTAACANPQCADMDNSGAPDAADVSLLVTTLTSNGACP